jgi:hypothetical protein
VALTPQDNEAFYREVDESLRQQQAIDFWRNHGRTAILVAVAVLVAVGSVLLWQTRQRKQVETHAEQLSAVIDDLDAGKTVKPPRVAPIGDTRQEGYRVASRMLAADLALRHGDSKAAVAGFGAVATDASLAQPYRDLALVRQTSIEFDQLPTATIVARMKPLAVPGGAWLGSAGEMLAAAYMRDGKPTLAGPVFAMIARDDKIPPSLRSRAGQMAAMLGTDAGPLPAAKE